MNTDSGQMALEQWVLQHAAAGQGTVYFRINGDIPVRDGSTELFFEVPVSGKRVLVLHPCRLTPVAEICYAHEISMI